VENAVSKESINPVAEVVESTAQVAASTLGPEVTSRGVKIWGSATVWSRLSILGSITGDAFALLAGLVLAGYVTSGEDRVVELTHVAPLLIVGWFVVFVAWDLYIQGPSQRNLGILLGAVFSGMGLLLIVYLVYPLSGLSLEEIALATVFIVLLEVGLQLLYKRGGNLVSWRELCAIPTLIIGEQEERASVRQAMERSPTAHACVGELDTHAGVIDLSVLRRALEETGAKSIVMAGTERLSHVQFPDLLRSMRLRGVRVKLLPSAAALVSNKPLVLQEDAGVPLLEVGSPRLDSTDWILKRMLDVFGSLGGLIILSPLLITVCVLIKLTSPGPVLFRQKRAGADEKVFTCYKFRSMYQDAERRQAELEAHNEAGGVIFKIKNDPRITPIGRFLRKTSLDELPQLINVLKGEMSLVGPRPLPLRDFELMSESHKRRLATVPGITGFWQVSGRSDLSFEEMLRLDNHYIENWSLSLDIKLLIKTIKVVLRHDGAC
jgi:exopolysaccharide biosynthesis polyprenyl glycosylphosphotransferase